MKSILSILSVIAIFSLFSCNTTKTDNKGSNSSTTTSTTDNTSTSTSNNNTTAASVSHYICPNNCLGGASNVKGNCPICANPLSHNAAFHAQSNDASNFVLPQPGTTTTPTANPAAPTPSPIQNAAGVYHYTCPKGCMGGGGKGGKCTSCSGDLAHNASYHQ